MKFIYGTRAACEALSMGRTRLFEEIKLGRLKPLQRVPKVLIHRDELERYAASLRDQAVVRGVVLGIDPHFNTEPYDD